MVMMKKSSGSWRLCCVYQEVNKHVVIPQQPLPRTDDILASFKGKRYFSVMDMCHGFLGVPRQADLGCWCSRSRGVVFGVVVLGRRRPGQPRLPRAPSCA